MTVDETYLGEQILTEHLENLFPHPLYTFNLKMHYKETD